VQTGLLTGRAVGKDTIDGPLGPVAGLLVNWDRERDRGIGEVHAAARGNRPQSAAQPARHYAERSGECCWELRPNLTWEQRQRADPPPSVRTARLSAPATGHAKCQRPCPRWKKMQTAGHLRGGRIVVASSRGFRETRRASSSCTPWSGSQPRAAQPSSRPTTTSASDPRVFPPTAQRIAFCLAARRQRPRSNVMNADGTGANASDERPRRPDGRPAFTPDGQAVGLPLGADGRPNSKSGP